MTRRLYPFVLLLTAMLAVVSCSSRLTPDNLSHIKTGMTSSEVKDLLGKPAEIESQSALGISGSTYIYRKDKSEVKIVFLNDKVSAIQSHLQ